MSNVVLDCLSSCVKQKKMENNILINYGGTKAEVQRFTGSEIVPEFQEKI